jgi:hypothetical protein
MKPIAGKILLLPILILSSCICDSSRESVSPIIDTELPSTAAVGTTVIFKVHHLVFNGCGEYSRHKTTHEGNTITVEFYGKYPECKMCPDNVPTLETTYKFPAKEKGDYYFRFYSNGYNEKEFILDTLKVW